MNNCPHCGAAIGDMSALFCTRCGKLLDDMTRADGQPERFKANEEAITEKLKPEDDYDGYYDDVRPVDEGFRREGLDRGLMKRILLLIAGFLLAIGACVVMMYLL